MDVPHRPSQPLHRPGRLLAAATVLACLVLAAIDPGALTPDDRRGREQPGRADQPQRRALPDRRPALGHPRRDAGRAEPAGAQGQDRSPTAMVPTPLCCPSRATILTGLYAHHTRVFGNGDIGGNRFGGWPQFRRRGMEYRTIATRPAAQRLPDRAVRQVPQQLRQPDARRLQAAGLGHVHRLPLHPRRLLRLPALRRQLARAQAARLLHRRPRPPRRPLHPLDAARPAALHVLRAVRAAQALHPGAAAPRRGGRAAVGRGHRPAERHDAGLEARPRSRPRSRTSTGCTRPRSRRCSRSTTPSGS